MRLLVFTQKVDLDDHVLGFFHGWLSHIAPLVDELHVVANAVGRHELPPHVFVYSLGREKGRGKLARYFLFYINALKLLPRTDGVFIHMCPEYAAALGPLNFFFRRPTVMWYAHIAVSTVARIALHFVDAVMSPSKESFTKATEKLVASGHGIDTDLFVPAAKDTQKKEGKKKILSLSRISRVKDIMVLIDALNILVYEKGRKDIIVSIVGAPVRPEDTAYLAELKKKVADYRLESYIDWAGPVPNRSAVSLYQGTDVFARMQPGGGYGKTELEAMATGTPAIMCTPVHNALLGDLSKDLYFKERDPVDFAEKLDKVLSWDEATLLRYRALARDIVVKNHNVNHVAQVLVNTIQKRL